MSRDNPAGPQNIDDYIAMQSEPFRATLNELRGIIRSLAPQAEEMISYQVPSFKHHYMLVGFGVNKKYCSLYPMSSKLTKEMEDDLKGIKISGTTLHFNPGEPLPVAVIKKIVLKRVMENEARATLKQKK
ncbi:MAG TPA: DUF1801 domain-containing protein [Mucilaginibacter sp.]|nr:DUF1801 domain-containing protein [Mucilaginibacter sp.]